MGQNQNMLSQRFAGIRPVIHFFFDQIAVISFNRGVSRLTRRDI